MPISRSRAPISARSDLDQELAGRDQAISDREQAAADRQHDAVANPTHGEDQDLQETPRRHGPPPPRSVKRTKSTDRAPHATATPPQVSATVPRTNAMTEGSSEMPTIAADPAAGIDGPTLRTRWPDPETALPTTSRPRLPGVGECIAAALSTRQPWRPRSSYLRSCTNLSSRSVSAKARRELRGPFLARSFSARDDPPANLQGGRAPLFLADVSGHSVSVGKVALLGCQRPAPRRRLRRG